MFKTQGLSPYFFSQSEIQGIIEKELMPKMKGIIANEIYFYGTGCAGDKNKKIVYDAIKNCFPKVVISVDHDMMGASRALCGNEKGVVCILGTGSNSCYYNGKKIIKNSPGIGYILGDEGSGAYLGKRIIQYFLYNTFDPDLAEKFKLKFKISPEEILQKVYKEPLANRYLASFCSFLSENRGHYMIENILEDGLNDFFFNHVYKFTESWTLPIHFTGGISYAFKDVIKELCNSYQLTCGSVIKTPIQGLVKYHRGN
ncbi:MAG: ATPase [Ginsengibacter sp.]